MAYFSTIDMGNPPLRYICKLDFILLKIYFFLHKKVWATSKANTDWTSLV